MIFKQFETQNRIDHQLYYGYAREQGVLLVGREQPEFKVFDFFMFGYVKYSCKYFSLPNNLKIELIYRILFQFPTMPISLHSLQTTKPLLQQLLSSLLMFQSLPDSLNNLMIVAEIGAVVIFSDSTIGNYLNNNLQLQSVSTFILQKQLILCEIILILLIQLLFKISFFKMTYLRYFAQLDFTYSISYAVLSLALISLILDFIKSTTTLVIFRNKWAQRYNQIKLLSYFVNISAVIGLNFRIPILSIVITILFFMMYIVKLKFPMVNKETQFLKETMYICGFSVSLFSCLRLYGLDVSFYYGLGFIILFFIGNYLLQVYCLEWKISKHLYDIEDLHKEKLFVKTIIELTNYLHEFQFRCEDKKKLKSFLQKNTKTQLQPLCQQTRLSYIKAIYKVTIEFREKYQDNIQYNFILAQLQIAANDNILGLIKIIHQIQNKLEYSIRIYLIKIQIFKLKELLEFKVEMYRIEHRRNQAAEVLVDGFFKNYSFVRIVIDATNAYSSLWEGYVDGYPMLGDMENKLDTLRRQTKKVKQGYQRIKDHKSKYSAWMYSYYLNLVSNDYEQISGIKLDLESLKSQFPDFMPYPNTIFVCVTLQGHIVQIGENSYGLIGYKKQELEDQQVLKIVPKFCHSRHRQWVQRYVNLVDNEEGIQSLIRWNKSSVLEDSRGVLKRMNVEFNLSLIDEEIRLAGGLKMYLDVKHIIAFKGNGEIIAVGDFQGEFMNKNIGEQNKDVKQIRERLMRNEVVKLRVIVNDGVLVDEYVLIKMIPHEQQEERIYIIEAIWGSNKEYQQKNALTIAKNPVALEDQQQQFLNLQKTHKQYTRKYNTFGSIWKGTILIGFVVVGLILTGFMDYINRTRNSEKRDIANVMRAFQSSALYIVNVAGKTMNFDFFVKTGISFASVMAIPMDSLQNLLNQIKKAFVPLGKIYQPLVPEVIADSIFQTKSLLITETIVNIFDYLLTFMQQPTFLKLAQYTAANTQTLLLTLLPLFEHQMIQVASKTYSYYHNIFLIQTIGTILLVSIQTIAIIYFHYHYKVQSLKISETMLSIQNTDLSQKIQKIEKFRKMIFCMDSPNIPHKNVADFSFNQNDHPTLRLNGDFLAQDDLFGEKSLSIASPGVNQSGMGTVDHLINPNNLVNKRRSRLDVEEFKAMKKTKIRDKLPIKPNYVLIFGVVFVSLGVCINTGLYYQLNQQPSSSVLNYIQSIVSVKGTFYAYQVMFTSLLLNFNQNFTKLDLLKQSIKNFTLSSNHLVNFQKDLFQSQEFNEFNKVKSHLDYDIICAYIECFIYTHELNLTYYTSIVYSSGIIADIYDAIESGVTDPLILSNYGMDYLLHADRIYLDVLNKTITTAFDGLDSVIDKVGRKGALFIDIQYLLFIVLGVMCYYEIWCFLRVRKRTMEVIELVVGKERSKEKEEMGME